MPASRSYCIIRNHSEMVGRVTAPRGYPGLLPSEPCPCLIVDLRGLQEFWHRRLQPLADVSIMVTPSLLAMN